MARRTTRTPSAGARAREDRYELFLTALGEGMTISAAAEQAGFARRADLYEHRDVDEGFAARWDEIVERTTEEMEQEAYRRAVEGWIEREIFDDDGNVIGHVRKFSDGLLMFMLKARRPGVYRENHRVQHVGPDGGPVNVRLDLDKQQRKALADVLRGRPATSAD